MKKQKTKTTEVATQFATQPATLFQQIRVNLQQTIVVSFKDPEDLRTVSNCIFAVANHRSKEIFVCIPHQVDEKKMGYLKNKFPDFVIRKKRTDSFSIYMWTNDGDKYAQ